MSMGDSLTRLRDALAAVLTYPVIPTQTQPITVATFLIAGLILTVSLWLSHRLQDSLRRRVLPRLHLDPGLEFSTVRFAHYAVLTAGILIALKVLRVDLTGLAVVAGILSVGVGFGLQNIASNFISGIILLIERPITVGDVVTVGDVNGSVRAINMRSTEIVTRDNITVIVPNSEFVSGRIVNWSHGDPKLRVRIPVGVSYRTDVEQVGRVLREVAGRHPNVLTTPPPEVRLARFGGSALDFELLVWIANPEHDDSVTSALNHAIRVAFLAEEIEIPFPQHDVTVRAPLTVTLLPEGGAGKDPTRA